MKLRNERNYKDEKLIKSERERERGRERERSREILRRNAIAHYINKNQKYYNIKK